MLKTSRVAGHYTVQLQVNYPHAVHVELVDVVMTAAPVCQSQPQSWFAEPPLLDSRLWREAH